MLNIAPALANNSNSVKCSEEIIAFPVSASYLCKGI
jgi:hypothetical protein